MNNRDKRLEQRTSNRCTDIISRIQVSNNITNERSILDDALSYCNKASGDMLEFKERDLKHMMVNHIRHEKSTYESGLRDIHRVSRFTNDHYKELCYNRYKNATLTQISIQYPYLAKECNDQKRHIEMITITR